MGLVKTLLKFAVLAVLGAVALGAAMLLRRSKDPVNVSYDQWPDVARNPAS